MPIFTGALRKNGTAWVGAVVKVNLRHYFTDGVYSYPEYAVEETTDANGEFSIVLDAPDSGTAEYEVILPESKSIYFTVSVDDAAITLEDVIAGAYAPGDQDTLATLLVNYLKLSGGVMGGQISFTGTNHAGIVLVGLTTAQRDALTAVEGMVIYNTDTNQVEAYEGASWGAFGGGASTFVGLTDTPGTITADQPLFGNAAGDALEFKTAAQALALLGVTDGGRMDWVIHVPGTLAANVNARWTIPVDCRILHISAGTSNNSDATIAFGISTDTDSILVPSTIGDSNVPVVFNSGDWAGTNPTADMTAGQIAVLTVDYDGSFGTAGADLTVIVTTTGNAVGDLADISDLAAAGFSASDYVKWNGSIFVNVTPAGVLSDIGAAALGANTFTGEQNLADNLLTRALLQDYGLKVNAIGSIGGGTQDIDFTLGNVVTATVDTSETTFTFSNPPPAGYEGQVKMYLTNPGSQTINWPVNMNWAGGVEPTWTVAGVDVAVVTTPDNGTNYYGFAAGLNMS